MPCPDCEARALSKRQDPEGWRDMRMGSTLCERHGPGRAMPEKADKILEELAAEAKHCGPREAKCLTCRVLTEACEALRESRAENALLTAANERAVEQINASSSEVINTRDEVERLKADGIRMQALRLARAIYSAQERAEPIFRASIPYPPPTRGFWLAEADSLEALADEIAERAALAAPTARGDGRG